MKRTRSASVYTEQAGFAYTIATGRLFMPFPAFQAAEAAALPAITGGDEAITSR